MTARQTEGLVYAEIDRGQSIAEEGISADHVGELPEERGAELRAIENRRGRVRIVDGLAQDRWIEQHGPILGKPIEVQIASASRVGDREGRAMREPDDPRRKGN